MMGLLHAWTAEASAHLLRVQQRGLSRSATLLERREAEYATDVIRMLSDLQEPLIRVYATNRVWQLLGLDGEEAKRAPAELQLHQNRLDQLRDVADHDSPPPKDAA